MKLLAIETATEACSIALHVDGAVRERFEIAPRRHAELALPWAEALLAEAGITRAQLDAVAVSRGPGAFTGVRLGIALAQGIALALDRPLVAVSTLAVLAMRAAQTPPREGDASATSAPAHDPHPILASIDARMGEVYAGTFAQRDGLPYAIDAEVLGAPATLDIPMLDAHPRWHAVGTGLSAVESALQIRLSKRLASHDATALPHAADLAILAVSAYARSEAIAPEAIEPAYLRNNVALTIVEQQALRASR